MLTELLETLRQKTSCQDKERLASSEIPSMSEILRPLFQKAAHPGGVGAGLILKAMNFAHTPFSRWGLGFLNIQPGQVILDIGCGGGANLRRMLDSAHDVAVKGLDLSESSVEASRAACEGFGGRAEVKLGGADSIPWPDEAFDIVTAFETVYFWPDLAACFKEVARVLKPGGLFQIANSLNPALGLSAGRIWVEALDIEAAVKADFGRLMTEAGLIDIQKISGVDKGLVVRGFRPA